MANHFKVKKVTSFKDAKEGDVIPESDYSLFTSDDRFVQFELVREDEKLPPYEVKPGIYSVGKTMAGYILKPAEFNNENIMDEHINIQNICDKIDRFFDRQELYRKLRGNEVPKRGFLLYGPPGCGKSQNISKICKMYANNNDTVVLIWHTDKFDPSEIKDFIKSFEYKDVSKFILVAEDLGGTEIDESRMRSDSSLLSLLDNVEKTFCIPTVILATTNHPEAFLGNLTNRPQRFDQCIEVKPPASELRAKFLAFFANEHVAVTEESKTKIVQKKFDDFSIAHIKECVTRAALEDATIEDMIDEVASEIARFKKNFQDKRNLGMGFGGD